MRMMIVAMQALEAQLARKLEELPVASDGWILTKLDWEECKKIQAQLGLVDEMTAVVTTRALQLSQKMVKQAVRVGSA